MLRSEKRQFIRGTIKNAQADLLRDLAHVPPEWDGHELREWIANRFALCSFTLKQNKRRYREYKNIVLVRNLL